MKFKLACLFVAAGSLGLWANSASAIDGPFGCYGGWNYGYLYSHLDSEIPYFAAYPPVYYSYPVPRTYGYSPFAYPPGTRTPEFILETPIKPTTILNPYVQQRDSETAESQDKVTAAPRTPAPLVIRNPYVKDAGVLVSVSQ